MESYDTIRQRLFQATTVARPSSRKDPAMARAPFWHCTPGTTNLLSALTCGQGSGDYDLSYLELINHEGDEDEAECTLRFAALHLHAAPLSRSIIIGKRKLALMLEPPHTPNLVGSRHLARLGWFFGDPPDSMQAYEFGVAEMVREKVAHLYEVRLTPVILHLARRFSVMTIGATFKDEVLETGMPITQSPKKRHACRQQAPAILSEGGNT